MKLAVKIMCATTLSSAIALVGCAQTSTTPSQNTHDIPSSQTATVNLVSATGIGKKIGEIRFTDTAKGLKIETNLSQLPPGPHGFHVHENPSCDPAEKDGKAGAALAAGSHLNTNQAKNHGTPLTGHLGDLPLLQVQTDGTAKVTLIAPRLKVADVKDRAVMIHAGGDNYSDDPKPLGGGGDRIACAIVY